MGSLGAVRADWGLAVITVEGAEQLAELSKRLKEAADQELKRELSKGIAAA